jgi:hypothetical protein
LGLASNAIPEGNWYSVAGLFGTALRDSRGLEFRAF